MNFYRANKNIALEQFKSGIEALAKSDYCTAFDIDKRIFAIKTVRLIASYESNIRILKGIGNRKKIRASQGPNQFGVRVDSIDWRQAGPTGRPTGKDATTSNRLIGKNHRRLSRS